MEFTILQTKFKSKSFKIEEDYPEVGVYLFVYQNGQCIKDYLQNDILACKRQALEEFGVPLNSWKSVDKGITSAGSTSEEE